MFGFGRSQLCPYDTSGKYYDQRTHCALHYVIYYTRHLMLAFNHVLNHDIYLLFWGTIDLVSARKYVYNRSIFTIVHHFPEILKQIVNFQIYTDVIENMILMVMLNVQKCSYMFSYVQLSR